MWLSNTNSHDWPSGADFATLAAPTTPVPPGLLSTLICQPVFSISLAWITRVMGSVEPPGGNGTTNLIGPFGQSPTFWAFTMAGAPSTAAAAPVMMERRFSMAPGASLGD